jgi:hypothetical protein
LSDVLSKTIKHKYCHHWQPTHLASKMGELKVPTLVHNIKQVCYITMVTAVNVFRSGNRCCTIVCTIGVVQET